MLLTGYHHVAWRRCGTGGQPTTDQVTAVGAEAAALFMCHLTHCYHPDLTGTTYIPPMVGGVFAPTDDDLHGAVAEWCANSTAALIKYGTVISEWNTGNVTTMKELFREQTTFNDDISKWDVRNVVDTRYMFQNARVFNGDVSEWNVSAVTDASGMFARAFLFNSDLSRWDVGRVSAMHYMFQEACGFVFLSLVLLRLRDFSMFDGLLAHTVAARNLVGALSSILHLGWTVDDVCNLLDHSVSPSQAFLATC